MFVFLYIQNCDLKKINDLKSKPFFWFIHNHGIWKQSNGARSRRSGTMCMSWRTEDLWCTFTVCCCLHSSGALFVLFLANWFFLEIDFLAFVSCNLHYGEVEKHNDVIHPWQSIYRKIEKTMKRGWCAYKCIYVNMMMMMMIMTIMMTTVMVMIEYGRSVLALMTEVCGLPGCYACSATIWFSFRSMRKLWRLWFRW